MCKDIYKWNDIDGMGRDGWEEIRTNSDAGFKP
jgi:hypothetical protein